MAASTKRTILLALVRGSYQVGLFSKPSRARTRFSVFLEWVVAIVAGARRGQRFWVPLPTAATVLHHFPGPPRCPGFYVDGEIRNIRTMYRIEVAIAVASDSFPVVAILRGSLNERLHPLFKLRIVGHCLNDF
jgi:hypothetical protein